MTLFRRLLVLVSLCLLAACSSSTTVATTIPTATSTPAPTATPTVTPLQPVAGAGWVPAVPYGKAIAFATDKPLVGYVCGNMADSSTNAPIEVGITSDGGRTWSTPQTLQGSNAPECSLSINPRNSQDIVVSEDCTLGCAFTAFRSQDGGRTWSPLTLPTPEQGFKRFVWNGTSLVVGIQPLSAQPLAHRLAISTNGAPLTWLSETDLPVSDQTHDYQVVHLAVWHSTLGLEMFDEKDQNLATKRVAYQSTDEGQTWTKTTTFPCLPGSFMKVSSDGKTVECVGPGNIFISYDSGASFSESRYDILASAPDGTLYAGNYADSSQPSDGVFVRQPGQTTWVLLFHPGRVVAASVNEQGHPIALWGFSDSATPGISYHAP